VKAALDRFLRVKVDASDRADEAVRETMRELGVQALPTLIFLGPGGEEVKRLVGPQTKEAIIATARGT
jgi:thiol:disulfide interchange protein